MTLVPLELPLNIPTFLTDTPGEQPAYGSKVSENVRFQ